MDKVMAVTELDLTGGVAADDFERFALAEYLPTVSTLGITVSLLRGNRGKRDRRYLLVQEFASVEHRDRVFPGSETPSLEVARWIEIHQALVTAWNALIASARTTHYVLRGRNAATYIQTWTSPPQA
jgi:hypothetical protein